MPIVTLITDYGTQDYYAGALKGVILGIAPGARIVDITHEVEPHNILHGALVLRQVWPWYPPGTIHLVVVDPGVGTKRDILLGRYGGRFVVAPDNGLVTFIHHDLPVETLHVVENRGYFLPEISTTFHGRDIMAPVVAHLANGVIPGKFGRPLGTPVLLPVAHEAEIVGRTIRGRGLYVDRFGTLVTNIHGDQVTTLRAGGHTAEVLVNGTSIGPVRGAFSDVAPGDPLAFVGGAGMLEIAVNQGRAVDRFGPLRDLRVDLR